MKFMSPTYLILRCLQLLVPIAGLTLALAACRLQMGLGLPPRPQGVQTYAPRSPACCLRALNLCCVVCVLSGERRAARLPRHALVARRAASVCCRPPGACCVPHYELDWCARLRRLRIPLRSVQGRLQDMHTCALAAFVLPLPSQAVNQPKGCRPDCNAPAWGTAMAAYVQHACMPAEIGTMLQAPPGSVAGWGLCHIASFCGAPALALHARPRSPDPYSAACRVLRRLVL